MLGRLATLLRTRPGCRGYSACAPFSALRLLTPLSRSRRYGDAVAEVLELLQESSGTAISKPREEVVITSCFSFVRAKT